MSMELNKESVEQAGGDERAAFNAWLNEVTYEENTDRGVFKVQRHQTLSLEDERIAWRAWQGRALLARSEQEEMERLREAYERGYGDGQNNPNGYSDKKERDACVNELLKQPSPAQAEDAPVIGCLCGMPMTEGHHSPDGCSSLEEFAPHLSAQAHPEQTEGAQGEREQFERWLAAYLGRKFEAPYDLARFEDSGEYRYNPAADYWKVWQEARAALAQPSPAQAEQHWPKLEKPVQVGAIRFHAGLSSRLVVEAAQRLYEFESTPEKEAERIERLQAFREQCFEPLGTEFSKVLSDNLPDLLSTAQAERPEFDESEREDMARIAFETAMANGISLDSFTFLSNSLAERYERIVGELRADRDSWAEQVEQRLADWDEMRKERDAALAKIAELDQALAEKDPFGAKLNRISEKLERCDALLAARAAQAGQVPQA
ncbi:TPA: hypothetical protein L4I51_006500, partial [Pseudomonas aeruginosa]|nr:hypothetical protein [Pseudomonas aeruginosa]